MCLRKKLEAEIKYEQNLNPNVNMEERMISGEE
jgi:hypothetical protein